MDIYDIDINQGACHIDNLPPIDTSFIEQEFSHSEDWQ